MNCSWRALRLQKPDDGKELNVGPKEVAPEDASSASVSKNSWWKSFDDEDDDDINLEDLSKAFSELATSSTNAKKQNSNGHSKSVTKPVAPIRPKQVIDVDSPGRGFSFLLKKIII